ncbi:RagB/SusD family nutrient uptake outer membrane protein [Solitalea lacus]|uniref:RagB/SusD family nutrient uptake outer membrane protein n=1 Tax=Solitalea lacus TaxID=2911172 RepID=UPI001EDA3A18|nr:RagB/SusD family nutrient uptake outer membrane protein [Solitalea lacus]UKJ08554.1 RagB/SusD family nutrient uptake outer membrane protein [Solitalea lacus]
MKNLKYIIVAVLALISTSCKDFLTVNPKTEMTQDVLFSTEAGFKDALSGVYIQMKGSDAYGMAMTMGTIEQIISSWDVTANSTPQKLGLFNYTDAGVEGSLATIYAAEYKIIASINAILNHVDERKDVFNTPGMYETIKAECLALRAYCHLDLLRLFGPIPTDPSTGNMLAYVTVLSKNPNQLIPFSQYQELLLKDLTEAEALLKDIDPITQYSLVQLRDPRATAAFNPADTYLAYRYYRMNYYAVKALQARAYLWFNNKEKAYECAKLVIDAKNNDGSAKFRLGTAVDMTNKDYVLTCEHICGLYDFNLYTKYVGNFANGLLKKGSTATSINTQLFGNTGTDIREANMWELITLANQSKCYVLKKYQMVEKPTNLASDFKQIPLLRISEMYMIAIEAGASADAQALWNTFRTSRNIAVTNLPADPTALKYELLKEYRKEFYGEGQAFFAYKRVNAPKANMLFVPAAATVNYLIPLPKTETINLN